MAKQLLRLKAFETTWGITPSVSAGDMVVVPVQSCDFKVEGGFTATASLGGGRNFRKPGRARRTCGGQLSALLNGTGHAYLWADLLGAPATTGSGPPYTHTFKVPATLPVGASFEAGDTTGLYAVFAGMRCGSVTIRFPDVGPAELTAEYRGKDDTTGTASLDSAPTTLADVPFDCGAASFVINIGGSAYATARLAEITISNEPKEPRYYLGAQGIAGRQPMGRQTRVSGRIEYDPADWAFYAAAKAATESSLELILANGTGDGTAGNERTTIKVPELFWHVRSPSILGEEDEPLSGEAEFTAFYDNASEATSFQVVCMNAQATI